MKLVYDTEAFKASYEVKSEQFSYLADYLNVCNFLVRFPVTDAGVDVGPFPPTYENYKKFSDLLNPDSESINLDELAPFPPTYRNYKKFSYITNNQDESMDLDKEKSTEFFLKRDKFADLLFDLALEFFKNGEMMLEIINFNDYKSFVFLSNYCFLICFLYGGVRCHEFILDDISTIARIDTLGHLTTGKAFELTGYWRAKMEEKKRNFQSTKPKTQRRKLNEEILKDLLKNHNCKTDREFLIQAQKATDRGERTVKNMLRSKNIIEYIKNNTNK
jgi:hypothetical protein